MPSVSQAQSRTMRAIAHGWRPSSGKIADIPVSVAKEFSEADKGSNLSKLPKRAKKKRTLASLGRKQSVRE